MQKIVEAAQILIAITGFVLFIDMIFFMLWFLTDQHPTDSFYFGAITANVLGIVL